MLLETGAVRQQTAERDGNAAFRHRDGEVDIIVHIAIEIEPACVDELHHGNAGEELRDRSRPHQRRIGGEWLFGRDVRKSIAPGKDQAIAIYRDRTFAFANPLGHQRVDYAGEIVGCQLKWR